MALTLNPDAAIRPSLREGKSVARKSIVASKHASDTHVISAA